MHLIIRNSEVKIYIV